MAFIHGILAWIIQHKLLTFLILASFSFFVSTICLAVENTDLKDELDEYRNAEVTKPTEISPTMGKEETSEAIGTSSSVDPGTESDPEMKEWRLPTYCQPIHYEVTLNPDLKNGTFTGNVVITFTCHVAVNQVTLHSKGLNFTKHHVTINNEKNPITNFNELKETVTFGVSKTLDTDKEHKLTINYTGDMKNRIVGFYSSSYKAEDGTDRYIATSKLEPTYARQAFPCFDEPNFKANYTVHLVKPNNDGYIALSNMDQVAEERLDDSSDIVTFRTSVPMSTYVAAFIVCDFEYTNTTVSASVGDYVQLRVYATPAQKAKTQFALDTAKRVTAYYIDYFKIAYPLPKLDMIAIPDFVSGAMEHWGLVTYRETALLYDAATSSAANKQRVATVVAHELAHMWFGNLVTLDWWNDLWLNEGFATYMQFKAIDNIYGWGMGDQFLISQLHSVLSFDSTLASHPIVQTVITPDQITEIFDSISYNKGAAVLRMLENAVGEDNFEEGIREYLNEHKYKNAVTSDLWDKLQLVADFNVKQVMDTWTVQVGYPVVNVNKEEHVYRLTQNRFLADPDHLNTSSELSYKWTIPITYITDKNQNETLVWFNKSETHLDITIPDAKWVKFNYREVGYYRVNYPEEMWDSLAQNIQNMTVSDKAHLLEDSFSLAKAGQLPYTIPLNMTKFLNTEKEYVPWVVAASKFGALKNFLTTDLAYPKLQKYVESLVGTLYDELGWSESDSNSDSNSDNDSELHLQRLLRATVLDVACAFGHAQCLLKASELFQQWLTTNDHKQLSQNTRQLVFEYGTVHVSEADWEILFNKYVAEIDAQEKLRLLKGLASTSNLQLLHRLIESAKDESIVRSQDYFTCLQYISGNPAGTALVWEYVREHWEELVSKFGLNDRYLGRLIPSITSSFASQLKLKEMEDFFASYPEAGAGAIARAQALETVRNNIKWLQLHKASVTEWLQQVTLTD